MKFLSEKLNQVIWTQQIMKLISINTQIYQKDKWISVEFSQFSSRWVKFKLSNRWLVKLWNCVVLMIIFSFRMLTLHSKSHFSLSLTLTYDQFNQFVWTFVFCRCMLYRKRYQYSKWMSWWVCNLHDRSFLTRDFDEPTILTKWWSQLNHTYSSQELHPISVFFSLE